MQMFTLETRVMVTKAWAVLLLGIVVISSIQPGVARSVDEIDLPRTEALIRQLTIETHVALASMREKTAELNLEVESLMKKTEENAQLRQKVEILQEENDEQRWKTIRVENTVFDALSMGCYTGGLRNYTRTWSMTATGRDCQRWDMQTPHKHLRWRDAFVYPIGETYVTAENYCRDPDGEGMLWCYTMDPEKRWEQCGIPKC